MAAIWKTEQCGYWPHFGRRLVEVANIKVGAHVLDIGSGRGTSVLPAAAQVGPGGLVVGIDNWDALVRGLYLEIKRHRLDNAKVVKMDAQKLGFKRESFDYVLSGFAYCFFSLGDVYPLLKKGGEIVLSFWAWQEDTEWMGTMVHRILPEELCDMDDETTAPTGDGRPRVYYMSTEQGIRNLMQGAGFKDIGVLPDKQEFVYTDEEEWWRVMNYSGWQDYAKKIDGIGPGVLAQFKRDCFAMLQKHKDAGGIRFTRAVWYALGTK